MKQSLGKKKIAKIQLHFEEEVMAAYTRGGWPHHVAEVWLKGRDYVYFNYKTMEEVKDPWLKN